MSTNFKKYFKVQPDNLGKNEKVFLFLGTIILIVIGYFLVNYIVELKQEKKEFKKSSNYEISIAKATSYIDRDSKTVFYYEVNGNIFKHSVRFSSDKILLGEAFKIRYKPSRPEIALIEFENPIIEKTDFAQTVGKIIELNEYHNRVKVQYNVDSAIYDRWIFVNSLNKFELNDSCELVYNIEQPEIAFFSYFFENSKD